MISATINMEIRVSNKRYSVTIEEDANINDVLDGVVAALQLEGFVPDSIRQGLKGKAESMEAEFNLGE